MKKFEYLELDEEYLGDLARLGNEGWELVAVIVYPSSYYDSESSRDRSCIKKTFYFKREKEPSNEEMERSEFGG